MTISTASCSMCGYMNQLIVLLFFFFFLSACLINEFNLLVVQVILESLQTRSTTRTGLDHQSQLWTILHHPVSSMLWTVQDWIPSVPHFILYRNMKWGDEILSHHLCPPEVLGGRTETQQGPRSNKMRPLAPNQGMSSQVCPADSSVLITIIYVPFCGMYTAWVHIEVHRSVWFFV